MRILMVTSNYPPMLNPISINTGKLGIALIELGHELTVVTQKYDPKKFPRDTSALWEQDMGEIIRLSPPWYAHPEKAANYVARIRMRERMTSWFAGRAYDRCRRLIKKRPFDVVMTRSLPVDCMIIGYLLRRRHKMRWVAGINDPFPPCIDPMDPYRKDSVFDSYEKNYTRKILSYADLVTFPSERLGKYMDRTLGLELKERLFTLPHMGWKTKTEERRSDMIEIVHAGTLGPNVSPDFFLWFFEELEKRPALKGKVRIVMFGNVHENITRVLIKHGLLDHLVTVEKPVPYEESLRRISRATACLLMEFRFDEGILLLSKFGDYAVSGKPVLFFSPEQGTSSDLAGGYGHPGFLGQDEARARERIGGFLARIEKGESLSDYSCPRPQDFEPAGVARGLMAALDKKIRG